MRKIILAMACFALTHLAFTQKESQNPFNQHHKESNQYISEEDSLEIVADLENARRQQMIEQRVRLRDARVELLVNTIVTISMELEINDTGRVVDVLWISGPSDEKLREVVINAVKRDVLYAKMNLGFNTLHQYTIQIVPN